jgi:hypothetical protein
VTGYRRVSVSLGTGAIPVVKEALAHARNFPDHDPIVVLQVTNEGQLCSWGCNECLFDKMHGLCPKCGHSWRNHDKEIKGVGHVYVNFPEVDVVYECDAYMGMGDWCGCEERSRRPLREVNNG